ncbi:sterol desaturase family protein [Cardiobacteriaceae bacterium TAE3-ERU3]|nr:sterol desaturase family protein [Cardiobacteriaceae bacterium TAE3-ERU3]
MSYLLDPGERLFWGYLLTSIILALVLTLIQQKRLPSYGALKQWIRHKDTTLDVKYFFVSWLIKVFVIAPLILSVQAVTMFVYHLGTGWIKPISYPLAYEWIVFLYTVSLFVFSDFTRYWLHRWLHTNRFLWAFHKVHHSPEILNPLSFYRVHPVENILFGLRYAISAGFVTGIFVVLFGARFNLFTILGVNGFAVLFSALGANLRHSPVRLSYGRCLEHIFISPAQHQIHHSTRHMHHNFGGYLAIWDWMFGSLRCNHEVESTMALGLGRGQHQKYDTISKILIYPFKESGRLLSRNARRRSCKKSSPSSSSHTVAPPR